MISTASTASFFLSDSQGLSNGGVDLETKLLLSLPAQVALRKLVDVGGNDVKRRPMHFPLIG